MDDDQQFCLRWNNHQSTLVAVFDTLLENGTLVDCTLAAEGKCLNAHKVVLSACSPYFESLLSRHFDKHPILILKDVKFQELKAMMDYMYRGEVNISQDQLGALLKAAESLQIKGLSDNKRGETERKPAPAPPPSKSPQPAAALPKVQGLTIEQRSREDSREGSQSPGPRKKKRMRRKSEDMDNHDASNSSESHSLPAQNIPSSLPAVSKLNADVPEPVETKSDILTRHKQDEIPQVPIIKEKLETHTELMLEPKSEYVEEMNEDSIEDLTLDDDDLSNMEQMDDGAGPSHGNMGEGSSQGFGWHMGNQSQDEVFLAAQEAVGAHRDSQGSDINSSRADTYDTTSTPNSVHIQNITDSDSGEEATAETVIDVIDPIHPRHHTYFDLKPVLKNCIPGKYIIGLYDTQNKLDNDARTKLVDVLIEYELRKDLDIRISRARFEELASGIVKLFPTEQKVPTTRSKDGLEEESDEEILECVQWLKNNQEPWSKVESFWKKTFKKRYSDLKDAKNPNEGLTNRNENVFSTVLMENYRHLLNLSASTKNEPLDMTKDSGDRFSCPKCSKSYKNKRHLYRHQKEECIDIEPKFICTVCFSKFRRKYHLSRHMNDAEPFIRQMLQGNVSEKRYQCMKCLKNYKHKHILRRHLKFECGIEPQFQCSICGHKKWSHLMNQRFTCDQCGRSYKHKTNLCNHKREECGRPPSYFCPVCKKGFKKKQHLQRHVTVHSDLVLTGPAMEEMKTLLAPSHKQPRFPNLMPKLSSEVSLLSKDKPSFPLLSNIPRQVQVIHNPFDLFSKLGDMSFISGIGGQVPALNNVASAAFANLPPPVSTPSSFSGTQNLEEQSQPTSAIQTPNTSTTVESKTMAFPYFDNYNN
ncbi:unnamed protein product [Brassicogethes aeneus]|uniref:Uncharacterized protein n=1 Tax=Brassicogethes aeneus TaxID=1431903 RepID=A0A9P0ASV3_BRAAE|nr:unnamed protein product [Brassicogethes aeneus]